MQPRSKYEKKLASSHSCPNQFQFETPNRLKNDDRKWTAAVFHFQPFRLCMMMAQEDEIFIWKFRHSSAAEKFFNNIEAAKLLQIFPLFNLPPVQAWLSNDIGRAGFAPFCTHYTEEGFRYYGITFHHPVLLDGVRNVLNLFWGIWGGMCF